MSAKTRHHRKKVVVIGGGLAGIASAALLAKQGFEVTVLEKNSTVGGLARTFHKKGFQFDMGPSWYMMPEVFEHFFSLFKQKPQDFYELVRLNPSYQVFFEHQPALTVPADIPQAQALFEKLEPGAGPKFAKYLQQCQAAYDLATKTAMYHDPSRLGTWSKLEMFWTGLQLFIRVNLLQSWAQQVQQLFADPRLFQILCFPAVFLGGSPYDTPALFSILSWADFGKGIWYPKGGMTKVVQAVTKLAKAQGVKIICDADVTEILVEEGRAVGVVANDQRYSADIVVGAAGLPFIETQLLPREYQTYPTAYWQKKTLSISAVLIYLGVKKKIPGLLHHSLYFSDDWQQNFAEIFQEKRLPQQPSFYISARTVTDPKLAPAQGEELVVLIPVPAQLETSKATYQKLADQVITKLEALLQTPLRNSVIVKELYTPNDFAQDYHAYQGTALGLAHTLQQSLFFRPGNRSKKVTNLYYAGQYTNPGIGVPMALVSAEIVSNLIDKSM